MVGHLLHLVDGFCLPNMVFLTTQLVDHGFSDQVVPKHFTCVSVNIFGFPGIGVNVDVPTTRLWLLTIYLAEAERIHLMP